MSASVLRLSATDLRHLRRTLLTWYDVNRRDLPWRKTRDPYRIWVSEIMLQQTRVAAVLEHYANFMKRFPTVQSLASARQQSVLAAWSGLGYYHRARRMHQAARIITSRNCEFPRTVNGWLELPGIGRYTAAAIASIAFGESKAVVDGNVERVLGRLFGRAEGREQTWLRAESLLAPDRPGDFNQAMMELGATICTPRSPQCLLCPLNQWCRTRGVEEYRARAPRNRKKLHYGFSQRNSRVFLVQRDKKARLMAGMWELPQIDPAHCNGQAPLAKFRHSITNTDYDVRVHAISSGRPELGGRWFTTRQWRRLALTGLAHKILRKLVVERANESRETGSESNQSTEV